MEKINITVEEMQAVLKAIMQLDAAAHISHMSRFNIALQANLKDTKVRIILDELIAKKMIEQYNVSSTRRPKYYYLLTPKGTELVLEQDRSDS